jgi:hypothetical protein
LLSDNHTCRQMRIMKHTAMVASSAPSDSRVPTLLCCMLLS